MTGPVQAADATFIQRCIAAGAGREPADLVISGVNGAGLSSCVPATDSRLPAPGAKLPTSCRSAVIAR